jgi:HAD superfamily hydrolase (TIGR01509 family)
VTGHAARAGVLLDVGYCLMDESARLERALGWLAATLADGGRPVSAEVLGGLYRVACRQPRPGEPSLLVQVLVEAGVPSAEAQVLRRAVPWDAAPLEAYPDAAQSLGRLRDADLRVGVLANQPASAKADLDRTGLSALCDGVWLSGAVGLAKPDPRFFALALGAWDLAPGHVAYVGDRPDNDVAPAKALGMATLRLRIGPHADQPPRGEAEVASMEARSLTDAVDRLLAWRGGLDGPADPGGSRGAIGGVRPVTKTSPHGLDALG